MPISIAPRRVSFLFRQGQTLTIEHCTLDLCGVTPGGVGEIELCAESGRVVAVVRVGELVAIHEGAEGYLQLPNDGKVGA